MSRRRGFQGAVSFALAAACAVAVSGGRLAPSGAQTAAPPDAGAPIPESANVKITFQTMPPVKAEVWWGKKRLGIIRDRRRPLIIERARDSGPLDVTIRAEGFLPVHTRAHTFSDHRLTVKLTESAARHTLFGYRAPVPDGGAPVDAGD